MKKRQREVRLMRAGIQLAFFIAAPSLFSTAFAGIKSIFLAIAAGQVELLSDCNSSASDLYVFFRKTFLRICMCIRIFWRCRV